MKKFLFVIAVLTAQVSFSQDCDSIILYEVDKMDDSKSWSIKNPLVIGDDKTGIRMNLLMGDGNKTIIWINTAYGVGCIDKGNKIDVLFTDGTKLQLYATGAFNCQEKSVFYFHKVFGTAKHLDTFCEKYIATIRVWSMKSYNQQDLSEQEGKDFNAAFNCLRTIKNQ